MNKRKAKNIMKSLAIAAGISAATMVVFVLALGLISLLIEMMGEWLGLLTAIFIFLLVILTPIIYAEQRWYR